MSRFRPWTVAALPVLLLFMLAGCAANPVTGRSELSFITPEQELEIGKQGYGPVVQEYGLYDDGTLQKYVDNVGQKVARASHLPNLEWHFTVVDDPTVNAFAMPGGYIYITRGLLAYLNSEAQLAGVLGHEIGHVTRRHTAARMTQQQLYGAGFMLGSILSPTFQRYSGAAQQGLELLFLKFSRTDESQADELGVAYAVKAGYDARELPATYTMLQRLGDQSGQRLPGFLETHPEPGDRARITTELAKQAVAGKTGLVINENAFIRSVDSILYGQDPRQGYFEGDRYFHPTLAFQLSFPGGWQHRDSRSTVAAGDAGQTAVIQLTAARDGGTLSPAAFVAKLQADGSISSSDGGSETIGGYAAWVGRLRVETEGAPSATLDAAFIRKGADLFQFLGQSAKLGDANEAKILATVRSFRDLTDPARIQVAPDRVRVRTVDASGAFDAVSKRLGGAPADLQTVAIMNNLEPAEQVLTGTLLKLLARMR